MILPAGKKVIPFLIVVAILAVFCFNYFHYWDFLFDDTYISMRYAKNFVNGQGLRVSSSRIATGCFGYLPTDYDREYCSDLRSGLRVAAGR